MTTADAVVLAVVLGVSVVVLKVVVVGVVVVTKVVGGAVIGTLLPLPPLPPRLL